MCGHPTRMNSRRINKQSSLLLFDTYTNFKFARMRAVFQLAATCILLFQLGCFPRPLDLQLKDSVHNDPVEGVTIHRHSVTLLSLLATNSNAVKSDKAGDARIWIPPFNTKLTFLEPGFEPASIGIFSSKTTSSMLNTENTSHMVLRFDDLDGKTKRTVSMAPVKYVAIRLKVIDESSGAPINDAEVLASTFLYLPLPGLEDRWGFPDLQDMRSDSSGQSLVKHASGFRNVITVRKPGYQEARQDFLASNCDSEFILKIRRLETKLIVFKAFDSESKKNIAGVVVRLDEQRNGLPPDPNAFAVVSDTTGFTPPVPVPNLMPLVIETNCAGYRRFSQGLDWRTLKDGEVLKLPLQKKGWFE